MYMALCNNKAITIYRFWIYERAEEQHFDDYTTELHPLANACKFKEHENMIRDKIVFSMKDKRIQERLLREVKLTLERAVDICKFSEVTRKEVQTMKKGPVESTKVVYEGNSKSQVKHKSKPASARYQHKKTESMKCGRCGRQTLQKDVQHGERVA